MTTLTHALSASIIALTVAGVDPLQKEYIFVAIVAAASLDLDHVYFLVRDRKKFQKTGYAGHLHKARSAAHELLGGLIVSGISAGMLFFDRKLAIIVFVSFMVHLIEDFIVGKSFPFGPFDKTEVKLFSPSIRMKGAIDVAVIIISVFLWKLYLNGHI